MLSGSLLGGLRTAQNFLTTRALASEATDPIQKLFLDKIREYREKSAGGKLVDPSPAIEKELNTELGKLDKRYGVDPAVDMTSFPSFTFEEPKLDPIDEQVAAPTGKQAKQGDKKGGKKDEKK